MSNPNAPLLLEELNLSCVTLDMLERSLRSAMRESHGKLALTSIPLTSAIEQVCALKTHLRLTQALLLESTEGQ
jgi:hypothetical protein